MTLYYWFCVKRITLCICGCSSSPSSRFSANDIWNIGKFGAKKYFIDHQTANAIQLFVPTKRTFFGSLFQNKLQQRGIPQKLLDKYSHLFICTSLRWTLNGGQKPVYTVKIVISEWIAFAIVLYFGQVFVFCRLTNKKSMLEYFLSIIYL